MALITSVILYEDKHEADVVANGQSYRITAADLAALAIREGELSDDLLDKLASCAVRLACIKKAFSVLSYGDVSVKRLCMKLSEKFDREISQEVSALMLERGYINEYDSAERFAVRAADIKLWGPMRIRNELVSRGYERDAVRHAVEALDEEQLLANLMTLVKKKMPAGGLEDIKIKSKLCAQLQRMGYSYSMINSALGAYDEQDGCFGD